MCNTGEVVIFFHHESRNNLDYRFTHNKLFISYNVGMKEYIIEVENLTKTYGTLVAVNGISFKVKNGEIYAFLGPNGAGKSTTIKMLTTVLRPTGGTIKLNGYNVTKDQSKARNSFGIVFQDPSLDDELTAYENMVLHAVLYKIPSKERTSKIRSLLDMVDLWSRKDISVKTFSGGMKRRLEIARGLLHSPRILFLDEPTLGLDPQTRNKIWEYVEKLNKENGTTIFFTTHYMEEAEKTANTVCIIDQGKIVIEGTLEELKEKTATNSLEEVFIKLTGKEIREEKAESFNRMRMMKKMQSKRF